MPIADTLQEWMLAQHDLVPEGSAPAKALGYSLKTFRTAESPSVRWCYALRQKPARELDQAVSAGRFNCLFAGSLCLGKRAAAIMSLIQARINGHDPYGRLKDELVPTQQAS